MDCVKAFRLFAQIRAFIVSRYSRHFGLKLEDSSVFIGLDVSFFQHSLCVTPRSEISFTNFKVTRFRFQNYNGSNSTLMNFKLVLAMLYRCVDLSSSEELAVVSCVKVFLELWLVGYDSRSFLSASRRIPQSCF